MSVVVLGINQRTASLDLLERTTVADLDLPKALAELGDRPNLSEALILSTCMRTEVYVQAERFHGAVADVQDFLAELSGVALEELEDHVYCYYEDAAVTHLFEVAAGIDSAVLGENEVLSQVRRAWDRAREEKLAGFNLSALFRHAVEVGKRTRSDTAIARGITSVSHAAVALVADRLGGSLEGRCVVLLGAGEVGEGMLAALAGSRASGELVVSSRTWNRAVDLASRIGAKPVEIGSLGPAMMKADVVLTSAGGSAALLGTDDMEPVMRSRAERPLLMVDVAVPRNVDPGVAKIGGVTLLDMDDIRAFAEAGMEGRRREISKVRAIIAEEVQQYLEATAAREAAPLVAALRNQAESVRQAELSRFDSRLEGLEPRQRHAVEALTKGIIGKLMHEPTVRLKEAAGSPRGERLAEALRALFDLD